MSGEAWFDETVFAKLKKTVAVDVLRRLLQLFLEGTATRVEEVVAADAAGDADRMAFALHSLKGSALMVGARELEVAAEDLRTAVRGGDQQAFAKGRDRLQAALERAHGRVLAELAELGEIEA